MSNNTSTGNKYGPYPIDFQDKMRADQLELHTEMTKSRSSLNDSLSMISRLANDLEPLIWANFDPLPEDMVELLRISQQQLQRRMHAVYVDLLHVRDAINVSHLAYNLITEKQETKNA